MRELLDASDERLNELREGHRLIVLRDGAGRMLVPAFQFDDGDTPLAPLIEAFWTLAAATVREWTAAFWCVAADDALDGVSPAVSRAPGATLSGSHESHVRRARLAA
ncbi:hypothetical protein [Candidatus Solirubrobacter pratensis]|uniref:hypothetical protein n=1 Tax=Candidatus Solirubrobacter pratensis TaxID=1298857 RepID=UPI00041042D3|nr:hypothetical protein [Candidatus Solirubrobacter pratensis]